MTIVFRLLELLISVFDWTKGKKVREDLRKAMHHEIAVSKSKKLEKAFIALRRSGENNRDDDKLHENDGYRRD